MADSSVTPNEEGRAQPPRLSRWRLILAHAVILFVITGQIFSIVFDVELWPFSPYPMYSTVRTAYRLDRPVLYAVIDDAAGTEIPLRELPYFVGDRAQAQLIGIYEQTTDTPHLRGALADLLARYEAERRASRDGGAPIRALRLYHASWQLAAGTARAETPDRRELIVEVSRGELRDG